MKEEKTEVKESDLAREFKSKIAMYEDEISTYKKIGNLGMANAIQKEVDNLKREALRQ